MPARGNMHWRFGRHDFDLTQRVLVMGIVNVTPDSFSEQGRLAEHGAAIDAARAMLAAGADVLDIGGESTRPGATPVDAAEECRRILPVIRALRAETDRPISVDTYKASVAAAALEAGADVVNDVSGFTRDPEMAAVAAAHHAGCVVMHMRGTPETMAGLTEYHNIFHELNVFFLRQLDLLAAAGVPMAGVALDPGIGFAKSAAQSLALIDGLDRLLVHQRPLLLGASRKSFIGKTLGIDSPADRVWGTAATCAVGIVRGARIVRVHDVAEMRQVCDMTVAILGGDA